MVRTIGIAAEDVGIILVNFRGLRDTLSCLGAVANLRTPPRRVIVVDNGSDDGSAETLRRELARPGSGVCAELLELPGNEGFAGGNNAALRLLLRDQGCRAFWLLNNDAEPEPAALDALCETLNGLATPGACGSLLVHMGGAGRVQCTGGGRLNRLLGTARHLGEGLTTEAARRLSAKDVGARLDYICGASLLVSRSAVERAGLPDEAFFLYYEDVEWGIRLRRAGFDLGYAPGSVVLHKEGGSTGAASSRKGGAPVRSRFIDYLTLRNRVWLVRSAYPFALPLVLASYLGVVVNRCRRGQAGRLGLVARAAWHGLTGRMGRPNPSNSEDRQA
ncbi:glycosyltransferase family 2 protein [Nitratidesulfovibrio oxamicus]|nr:glycosyltransferase family 2 protein [Nitratidesulfovibrio oxamicus]